MVTHIVAWNLKPDLPEVDKEQAALQIKAALEALDGRIDGLLHIEVLVDAKESSQRDVMLYTEFTNEAALQNYQVHPEHVAASSIVKTMTVDRMCLDFEQE